MPRCGRSASPARSSRFAGLKALRSAWPEPVFWNLYGPTETNVCTAQRIPAAIEPDRVEPFRSAVPATTARSPWTMSRGSRWRPGTGGIVCRGGPVMRCYWGRAPGETEAFVDLGGQRWYDTGDLGSFLDDGAIHFSGRRDRMVKRHGYRIELGEIEAGLDRADFLSEAAVVSVEHEGAVSIHAFVVSATDSPASVIALRTHCASVLPPYMTPDRFHAVDELPRTGTGKVDLARLRSATSPCDDSPEPSASPRRSHVPASGGSRGSWPSPSVAAATTMPRRSPGGRGGVGCDRGGGRPAVSGSRGRPRGRVHAGLGGRRGRKLFPEIMPGGVAVFDVDGDDDLDIYFVQFGPIDPDREGDRRNRLYLNDGEGRLRTDEGSKPGRTIPATAAGSPRVTTTATVTSTSTSRTSAGTRCFATTAAGRFEDVTEAAGAGDEGWEPRRPSSTTTSTATSTSSS